MDIPLQDARLKVCLRQPDTRFLVSGFLTNQFLHAPEYPVGTISTCFENFWRFS
jgi:hypothetical protein